MDENNREDGVAALPVLILITLIILLVGIAISGVGFIEGALVLSQDQSREAYYISELGIHDALIKLARDKDFTSSGYCLISSSGACPPNGDRYANIVISGTTAKTITSTGYVKNKQRKIQVTTQDIQVNDGQILITNWQEQTI